MKDQIGLEPITITPKKIACTIKLDTLWDLARQGSAVSSSRAVTVLGEGDELEDGDLYSPPITPFTLMGPLPKDW